MVALPIDERLPRMLQPAAGEQSLFLNALSEAALSWDCESGYGCDYGWRHCTVCTVSGLVSDHGL